MSSPLSNMSQSSSSSKKMLDFLNEIDPVAFYTSSDAPSPSKMSTISPVNITEASPLTPQTPIDLNNPAPSHQPSPYSGILFDQLFEGDLPNSKFSESNILAASESLVIESLAQMREMEVGVYQYSDPSDTDEDNVLLKWSLQRRMVPITSKGKEKVTEETPRKRPFTRAVSQKLMGDAMKSTETTTAENRRRRRSGDTVFEMPTDDIVNVSIEVSEHKCVGEDSPLGDVRKEKGKQVKKTSKRKSKASAVTKGNPTKGKMKRLIKEEGAVKEEKRNFSCSPARLCTGTRSQKE
ncbi:hypothetical protein KY285_036845 [Solanum tuberosum]|nr:hypothetical protein KY285_036845 [Solanum tuberosum]